MVVNDGIIHLLCSVFGTCLMNGMMVYIFTLEGANKALVLLTVDEATNQLLDSDRRFLSCHSQLLWKHLELYATCNTNFVASNPL